MILQQDIEVEGTCIVSCGMDHSLKIWKLTTDHMLSTISHSYTFNPSHSVRPFPTVQQNFPDFSTRDIHRNYVDCVRWLGRFILSKVSVVCICYVVIMQVVIWLCCGCSNVFCNILICWWVYCCFLVAFLMWVWWTTEPNFNQAIWFIDFFTFSTTIQNIYCMYPFNLS